MAWVACVRRGWHTSRAGPQALETDTAERPAPAVMTLRGRGAKAVVALSAFAHPSEVMALAAGAAAGMPAVVKLWGAWCDPCRRELPLLAAAPGHLAGARFVFENHGESAETVCRCLQQQGLGLSHVLMDPQSGLGPALGSGGLPTTVFFDRQGQRVEAHMGALNAAALNSRIGALLAP